MLLSKVVGEVVATQNHATHDALKLLLSGRLTGPAPSTAHRSWRWTRSTRESATRFC